MTEATLRRAHAVHPIAALQVEYSPFFLDIEEDKIGLLKACRELGIAVVAYSPLGRGMLTGAYVSPTPSYQFNVNRPKILKTLIIRNPMMTFQTANGGKRFQSKYYQEDSFR